MYFSISTLALLASFVAIVQASPTNIPSLTEQGFTENQVKVANGSIVSVWVRNTTAITNDTNISASKCGDFWSVYYPFDIPRNECENSSLFKATCELSASVPDCQAIVDQLTEKPGNFEFHCWSKWNGDGFHTLIQTGQCAFGISMVDATWTGGIIGNTDITDLIIYSWKYAQNERVGTYGQLKCGGGTRPPTFAWALYRP